MNVGVSARQDHAKAEGAGRGGLLIVVGEEALHPERLHRGEVQAVASALRLKKDFRYVPGVTIGVSAERDLDSSWVVGPTLSLEVPIFDQGQAGLARLAAEYRRTQRHFEALAINIRSEVRAARDALIAARDAADYHGKVLLPQRQSILRNTLLHYNAMMKSSYELLLAKEREQQAEQSAIET